MAIEAERLIINLEARLNKFDSDMRKAAGISSTNFRKIERDAQRAQMKLGRFTFPTGQIGKALDGAQSQFLAFSKTAGGVLAGVLALKGAQSFIDGSIRIQNALKGAGLAGEQLTAVYDQLFASAQRNAAPVESLVKLYSQVSLNMSALNTNSAELAGFTDTVAMALRAGGTSATEASGALMQLSQSLGGGVVRAEEFNSILEGAPVIAQAAAAGISEAGGSVAELRKLMLDGQISSEAFFRGIEAGAPVIADRLKGSQRTISDSFTTLYNSLTKAAGEFNNSTEASNTFGTALDNLSSYIDSINFDSAIGQIQGFIDQLNAAIVSTTSFMAQIGRMTGLDQIGEAIVVGAGGEKLGFQAPNVIADRMTGTPNGSDPALNAYIRKRYPDAAKAPRVVPPKPRFNPISIETYPVAAAPAKGGGGGGRSKAGGGGRDAGAEKAKREADAVKELIADLEREKTLIGATDVEREISNALRQAGAAATDEQKAKIFGLITAIDAETQAMERQEKAQEALKDTARDALRSVVDGIKEGASAGEILGGVLENLASKLADLAIDNLVESFFGGSGGKGGGAGGIIGKIFGFADGGVAKNGRPVELPRFAGGGIARSASIFGEAGAEAAVPLPDGRRIPVDLRAPDLRKSPSGMAPLNVQIVNNTGVEATPRTERQSDGSLRVTLDKMQADNLSRRGSKSNAALRNGFGASPALKNRG